MSLSAHLLIRMTLVGILCWLLASAGVVWRLQQDGREAIEAQADALQQITERQLRRQLIAQDAGGRLPDLARVVSAHGRPVCLRYKAIDQAEVSWGCQAEPEVDDVPVWLRQWLADDARWPRSVVRPVTLWSRHDGQLAVQPVRAELISALWARLRDLMGLTAATIIALDLLVWLWLRRLLRPTQGFVAALDRLGQGQHGLSLPPQGAREFRRISEGMARLGQTLQQLTETRTALTLRLIDSQEAERRDIARDLHDELGQCMAALQAVSAGIRQSALAGEPPTSADTEAFDATLDEMASGLRALLARLRPPWLDEQGLPLALRDLVQGWNQRQRLARRPALRAELLPPAHWPEGLDEGLSVALYRACQEALTNAARHADATEPVRLSLQSHAHGWQLSVRNRCPSSPPLHGAQGRTGPGSGLGLRMLEERLKAHGGRVLAGQAGGHFTLQAEGPWPATGGWHHA